LLAEIIFLAMTLKQNLVSWQKTEHVDASSQDTNAGAGTPFPSSISSTTPLCASWLCRTAMPHGCGTTSLPFGALVEGIP
jgi:hypothetical protein